MKSFENTLGQLGSILVSGTSLITCGVTGKVFTAITMLEDTVFASAANGLSAETLQLFPDDTGVGSDISANGAAIDGEIFPKGVTIYGRWTGFTLASGLVLAYVG